MSADFLAELTDAPQKLDHIWVVFIDGSYNGKGSGACIILENNSGMVVEVSLIFEFMSSNNQA